MTWSLTATTVAWAMGSTQAQPGLARPGDDDEDDDDDGDDDQVPAGGGV